MTFTQMMTVRTSDGDRLREHLDGWHREQHGAAPGYESARILADLEHADQFVIEVDFASEEEARRNSDRSETQAWADRLKELVDGEPTYQNLEVAWATG
jgi:hypothetical protein